MMKMTAFIRMNEISFLFVHKSLLFLSFSNQSNSISTMTILQTEIENLDALGCVCVTKDLLSAIRIKSNEIKLNHSQFNVKMKM